MLHRGRDSRHLAGSLQGYVYRHAFHFRAGEIYARPERAAISHGLLTEIKAIDQFNTLPFQRIENMLYAYLSQTPRDTDSPFVSFLDPDDGVEFFKCVIAWADYDDRKLALGRQLNSLTGSVVARNIGRTPAAQRAFADAIIEFYERNYTSGWGPAKLLHEILESHPELKSRVSRRDYGFSLD